MTWWGCASVELFDGSQRLLVDPFICPRERPANYICITHADADHCHEPTLRRLVSAPEFERLLATPACTAMTALDIPHNADPADLAFVPPHRLTTMYPKRGRGAQPADRGPTEMTLGSWQVETIESSEQPQRYKAGDGVPWPALTGPFAGDDFPNVGYLVTHTPTGVSFLHPGDLTDAYDALRDLRGRVDYLFLPTVKVEGIELTITDAIRPRVIVPIHYRVASPDFPIPLDVTDDELATTTLATGWPRAGSDPDDFRRDMHRMMLGHWYPTPDPPLARIEALAPQLLELGAELLVLHAGTEFAIDA